MVGIVSQDLRKPLSGIAMGAAVLARGDLTDSQQRTLSRISRSTDRANRLIADLLDFTKARLGGGLKVTLKPIDLHQIIGDAVHELVLAYSGRALKHVRVGEGACEANPDRLVQIVGNLVSNAMSYGAPERPATVTSCSDDTSVSAAVHNWGPPIADDVQARIFDADDPRPTPPAPPAASASACSSSTRSRRPTEEPPRCVRPPRKELPSASCSRGDRAAERAAGRLGRLPRFIRWALRPRLEGVYPGPWANMSVSPRVTKTLPGCRSGRAVRQP